MTRIATIGGYGFTADGFIAALTAAGVDALVDVRQRRVMRGSRYAFLNSARLQAILAAAPIAYVYGRDLAPTTSIRDVQKEADRSTATAKRDRSALSPRFVERYQSEILDRLDLQAFREQLRDAKVVALFCVEANPFACHRSLAAEYLAASLGMHHPVQHIGL